MKKWMWILALAGCSTPAATPAPRHEAETAEAPVEIQAESSEWRKITEELLKGKTVAEQQSLLEAERAYQLALSWYNKGDFDKAKEQARRAVQLAPEHLAARKLLNDIHAIIAGGGPVPSIAEHDLRVAQVTVEQQQIEIANHLVHGGRYFDARMYASALREFENAEFKIRNMPYDVKAMNDLLPKVRAMIARAKSSIRD